MNYMETSDPIQIEFEGDPYYIHTVKMFIYDVFIPQEEKVEKI